MEIRNDLFDFGLDVHVAPIREEPRAGWRAGGGGGGATWAEGGGAGGGGGAAAGEKEVAEAEEVALRAELEAERGAAETAASEAMLMIERLQREKAAALMEARQFRRLAEGRADRDRELQDELASLSALAASYLSLLHAHGIDPDEDDDEEHSVEHTEAEPDVESGGGDGSDIDVKGTVVEESASPLPPPDEEFEYTIDVRCSAATKAVAAAMEERVVGIAGDLYARMETLEADREVMRRQVAALRAESAQVGLAREMARRLCREAVAAERGTVVTAENPRFSVLAIFKEKEMFYSQVYIRLADYAPRPACALGHIHRAASPATSAQATNVTIRFRPKCL